MEGNTLFEAMEKEKPLQVVGVLNAITALLAQQVGFSAIYLSGGALSTGRFALPDRGLLSLDTILEEVRCLKEASTLPLIVDIDTGWDHPLILERGAKCLLQAGAQAIQIEDQVAAKKCGHLEGKSLVSQDEMVERIQSALNPTLAVIARTDALASEGIDGVIKRAVAYEKAGADLLFLEAVTTLKEIETVQQAITLPVMINMTEFGKTPLWDLKTLHQVDLVLYPMSIARVMYGAAKKALIEIKVKGTQKGMVGDMLTREELYHLIDYHN